MQSNYHKKTFVKDTKNTYFDYQNQNGVYLAEILRSAHSVTYNCLYSLKIDIFEESVRPMSQQDFIYKIKMFLKNDEEIFDDILKIVELTVDSMKAGSVEFRTRNWIVYKIYQFIGLDPGDFKGYRDDLSDIFQGLDYRSLGYTVGDIIGRLSIDV